MNRQIFRQEALDRLASPDRLDQLMPLTSPRRWLALVAAALLIVAVLAWSLLGSLVVAVEGEGVLSRAGGVWSADAPQPGVVGEVAVALGEEVAKGQPLVRLLPPAPPVVSPFGGRVLDVLVRPGERVEKGAALAQLESLEQPLQAVLFVPAAEGYRVRPGMEARISLAGEKGAYAAGLPGRVKSAARFPAARASLVRALHGEGWADRLSRGGPLLEIVVELTGAAGAPGAEGLYSGTPCQGEIIVGRQRPIRLILPSAAGGGHG